MSGLIRILSGAIDFIIVLLPIQFIMMGIFGVSDRQADLMFKLLFAVYGTLFVEYMGGRTPGKYFGRIKVTEKYGTPPSLLSVGLRELSKSLYLIPYIGWTLGLVSAGMIVFGNGRAIHDYIGNTCVVCYQEKDSETDGNGV